MDAFVRPFGMSLDGRRPKRVDLLITHLHTDHIEGLRFFGPFWDPDVEFRIWGPPAPTKGLEQRLAPFFSPPYFPVHMRNVPSRPEFLEVSDQPWTIGSVTVSAALVKHPGPAVGYRIEDGGGSLAYLPVHEPGLGTDLATMDEAWISGLGVAHDVDLLIHDGQYTVPEYAARVGWGHSSIAHVVTPAPSGSCCSTTTRCTATTTSRRSWPMRSGCRPRSRSSSVTRAASSSCRPRQEVVAGERRNPTSVASRSKPSRS